MEPNTLLGLLFLGWLISGLLGWYVAPASRAGLGLTLGFLLGPFGLLVAALLKPDPAAAPAFPHHHYTPPTPPPLPDTFTIRRGFGTQAQHHGPYTLEEVIHYLANGTLLPTDHYRTTAGHWSLLSNTGLI